MKKSTLFGAIAGLIVIVAVLAMMRSRVSVKEDIPLPPTTTTGTSGATGTGGATGTAGQALEVGFLPVTCHLTCPVTAFATKTTTTSTRFISKRFTNFPDVVDNIKSKRLKASFMIAPLAMKLRE